MTTTITAHPTHGAPLTDKDLPWRFYRVSVCFIGEDADYVIGLGHVDPKRFVGAAHALHRDVGSDLRDAYDTALEAVEAVHHRWAVRAPDCTYDGDGDCPQQEATDCLTGWYRQEHQWFINFGDEITETTAGAFPVTVLAIT